MEKQCEVLIRTGENKFIPVGIAEIEIDYNWHGLKEEHILTKATLKKININVKEEDVIWEAEPDIWIEK